MANFDKAYKILQGNEGGYVNDPDDNGGETFAGVSRKFHPKWIGWKRVDTVKGVLGSDAKNVEITKECFKDSSLMNLVKKFYKQYFWDTLRLDEILSDSIAKMLFDAAVNMGLGAAVKLAYRSCKMKESTNMSEELFEILKKMK